MQLSTKFSVNDSVLDKVSSQVGKIIGMEIKHGKLSASLPEYHCCTEYYVDIGQSAPCYRAEYEIEPIPTKQSEYFEDYFVVEKAMKNGFIETERSRSQKKVP